MHLDVAPVHDMVSTGSFRLMGMSQTVGGYQNSIKRSTQKVGEHANFTKQGPEK